jgi:hypothetical protein
MNALAVRGTVALEPSPRPGSGMALQTLAGTVSAFFTLESFDRRRGVAIYALRVINRTPEALVCRTWVLSRDGQAALAYPVLLEVAPLSAVATHVPVWPKDFGSFDRAIAEVAGEGVHCIVEAEPPRFKGAKHAYALTPLTMLALNAAVFATAVLAGATIPRLMASAVPPRTSASTSAVTAAAKFSPAQIDAISVHPAMAKPGERIDVSYAANADGGYIRLLGSDGTIWEQKAFSRDGQTSFVVPPVRTDQMRVLLHVSKGKSTAQSMAGLGIAAAPLTAAPVDAPIAGDDDPNVAAAVASDANGTFEVLTRTVKSGEPLRVRIISPRNGMRIALNDPQSHEVAGSNVGAEAEVITLRAPHVLIPNRYTVVASFTDGFGQESIVQAVRIVP